MISKRRRNICENTIIAVVMVTLLEVFSVLIVIHKTIEISHYSYVGTESMVVTDKIIDNNLIYPFSVELFYDKANTRIVVPSTLSYFNANIGDSIQVDVYLNNNNVYYYIPRSEEEGSKCDVQFSY